MTQSKKDDDFYTINLDDLDIKLEDVMDNSITIDLNNTYGTTTTYWNGDNITDTVYSSSDDITINIGDYNLSGNFGPIDIEGLKAIHPTDVEKMCKEYPALEKVWRNFKAVYDMVKQDYEGKKQAGEIDDDELPF